VSAAGRYYNMWGSENGRIAILFPRQFNIFWLASPIAISPDSERPADHLLANT
jgi:hypothetical protein